MQYNTEPVQSAVLCYKRLRLCVLLSQVEKSTEGAGPLRTVKIDNQEERAAATVNSVSSGLTETMMPILGA